MDSAIEVRVGHVEDKLEKHEEVHLRLYDAIDALKQRPPVWVMLALASVTTICGWLLHAATSG